MAPILLAVYAGVAVLLLAIIRAPHTPADYLVAGTMATLATLLALFATIAKKR